MLRTTRRRAVPLARSLLAIGLAALLLIEGVASTLHMATVRHTVCPEHGESLDVAIWAPIVPADAGERLPAQGPIVRTAKSPSPAAHDPCVLGVLGRARHLAPNDGLAVVGRAPEARAEICQDQSDGRLSVPRILFAPKHSPPA